MSLAKKYSLQTSQGKLVLFATTFATGMAFFLSSSVNVALPTIQRSLKADLSGIQWVVNAETLILASFLLTMGSLGDHYGRKKIFSIGILVCCLASFVAGFSQSIEELIFYQGTLGLGAAMMIPGSLAIINAVFPESERGQAIGFWSGMSAGVATLGPFLGGWVIEFFDWRAVFFMNIPIGIISLFLTLRFVPESRNPHITKLDWPGTFWISFGLVGVSYALVQAPIVGWSAISILASFSIGIISICIFFWVESHSSAPMVPLHLFKNPLVAGSNLVTFFLYFSLYGLLFFLVINFQQFQGYSPMEAGASMLPPILLITFFSKKAGAFSDRVGARFPMILGPALVGIGMGSLLIADLNQSYFTHFLPGLCLFGGGMSLVVAPLTKSALSVQEQFSGAASGVNNAVSRVASLMAVTILGSLALMIFQDQLKEELFQSSLSVIEQTQILEQARKLGGIEIPPEFSTSSSAISQQIIQGAFLYSFRWVIGVSAGLAFFSAFVSILTIPSKVKV